MRMGRIIDNQKAAALESIEGRIYVIRGLNVMISPDLADLYEVEPRALIQAMKRNLARFPADFMFQLTGEEHSSLKSQNVISSWGGARSAPYAFTEQGVAMLATVLKSPRAVSVSIEIMRAFVRLRRMALPYRELATRINELEGKYDRSFRLVFDAIKQLMNPPYESRRAVGFQGDIPSDDGVRLP